MLSVGSGSLSLLSQGNRMWGDGCLHPQHRQPGAGQRCPHHVGQRGQQQPEGRSRLYWEDWKSLRSTQAGPNREVPVSVHESGKILTIFLNGCCSKLNCIVIKLMIFHWGFEGKVSYFFFIFFYKLIMFVLSRVTVGPCSELCSWRWIVSKLSTRRTRSSSRKSLRDRKYGASLWSSRRRRRTPLGKIIIGI